MSSQHTNEVLNSVTENVGRLLMRSQKLEEGDPAAKTLVHEIAVTLATAFAEHGHAATSLTPLPLSCAAEIWDNSGPNGKLKALLDWNAIADNDPHIQAHPLFMKTLGYQHPKAQQTPAVASPQSTIALVPPTPAPSTPAPLTPAPLTPAPLTPAPLTPAPLTPAPLTPAPLTPAPLTPAPLTPAPLTPAPLTPAPLPPAPLTPAPLPPAPLTPAPLTPAPLTPAPSTPTQSTPTPAPATISKKPGILVLGTKCKALEPEPESEPAVVEVPAHLPKKRKMLQALREAGRAPPPEQSLLPRGRTRKSVKLVKLVKSKEFVDEDDEVPKEVSVGQTEEVPVSIATDASAEDDEVPEPVRLFGVQCERFIKDSIPCLVILGKKLGEVWKCCRNCDKKKTKCIRPSPEQDQLLCAAIALKKAKAAAAAEKKASRNVMQRKAKTSAPHSKFRTWSKVPVSTRSTCATSRMHPPSPSLDEKAEPTAEESDQEDPDSEDVVVPTTATAATATGVHPPIAAAHVPSAEDKDMEPAAALPIMPAPTVDNDVNMDFAPCDPLSFEPEVHQDTVLDPPVAQPTALNIFQSIKALGRKFNALLKNSGDCAEALHEQMGSWVSDLDEQWTKKFAAMEEKIWNVEMKTVSNSVSIRHMANAMNTFGKTGKYTSFRPPPAGPSVQGHPFGHIPPSWLPQLLHAPDAGQTSDQSVSAVGREWTTT
ncbi:hypothetical protein EV702DRAFT_1201999 [Suillus placidus]|uniref:Uncharacterized protein n=1 Tax=Suillus placidus TaxID=48579 RepID=A0A9P7CXT4_9AGAM|nr:hypothetical protein EV702DRAFT_1201999 [Suillus placidus]